MAHTKITHNGDMSFSVDLQGHSFTVDADEQFGGKNQGPRPKALLLSGLAGCTGMDVVAVLGKMQMPYDNFTVDVEGVLGDEHPKVYTEIKIIYTFTGSELDMSKIEKAVNLSLNKYCGVSAMLGKTAEITHEILLNP